MIFCYRKKLIDKTGASLNLRRSIPLLLMTVALWLMCAGVSYGAIIINAPMTDTNSSGWTLGGNPNSSLLTGNGTIDASGSGWLRLTDSEGNQTGFAYNNTTFDLSGGLLIQFDYTTWGGSGADGYSVYLFDSGVSTFNIGAFGGSLGYAQKLPPTVTPAVPGISGGYIGIGVDEFGNFSNPTEGRYLGPGVYPNTVTLRGSVVGFGVPAGNIGQTTSATSYPWIATSANNGSLWYNGTPRPSQTSTNYRKVVIQITPAPNPVASVWIQFGYNQPLTTMISGQLLPSISTSQSLKMGYAASTGGSTNYHEIRNLLVTNAGTSTAIDLGITNTASVATATIGSPITYTVTARNFGPNNITATGVGITDTVPAGITGVTWTCAVVAGSPSGTSCVTASGSGNALSTTANLPYGGAVVYTITGTVSAPAPAQLSNTASLTIPGVVTDYNPNNNSATVIVPVTSNLSTSTKTVTDLTSSDYAAGDVLQYTITLNESIGAGASGVSVADTIDTTNLTGLTITSCPSGATCSYSAGALTVTGISIPAYGTVTIVYTATISGSATPGTDINNTATVANPNGTGATAVAPVVTVGGTVAGTGNKLLYLWRDSATTGHLNRAHATVAATYVQINGGTAVSWALNPVLRSAVTITGGAGVTIPVRLWLSTNNTRTYTLNPITLTCGATTLGTLTTGTAALTNGAAAALFTFNVPHTTTQTCAAGSALTLSITNTQTAGRYVYVYPAPSAGNYSTVNILSQNVINVDSIDLYSATYPSAATITSVAPGSTVYIRATVSDPFGSYDITGLTITITDPLGTVRVNAAAMTQVYDSGAASEIHQYAYAVPSGAAVGNWSISVTATEGAEGTISNTGYATMPVYLPALLTVVKSASPSPISPGQVLTYTITITNTGAGTATNVTAIDPLPAYTTYQAGTTTLNSITVAGDGATSPLIAGLLVDNNSGRSPGVAASGTLPAGGVATITFQVKVN